MPPPAQTVGVSQLSSHAQGKECLSRLAARAWGVVILENSCQKQAFISPCEESHGHLPPLASENFHTSAQSLQKSCRLNLPAFWHCPFPGCQRLSHPGDQAEAGRKDSLRVGQRQGDLAVLNHMFVMLCVSAYLCSGDSSESRVWRWKCHRIMCCLVDFQLYLHQLA